MFKNKISLYIKLMRLDKPIGILLLLWPPFWVIAYATEGSIYNQLSLIFLVGIVTTRTIGCVINDFFDKDFDVHVSRTSSRPYALGLISKKEIFIIFLVLSIINISLLFFLNTKVIYIACAAIIFIILYPLTKRFFKAPQIFLGITFALSTLMAYSAVKDVYPDIITWVVFFATIIWVTMFDTIYAIFGYLNGYSYIFFTFLILAIAVGIYNQVLIRNRHSEFCIMAFKNNQYIGLLIFLGIYGEYIL
jgi:4-hydroxybenzoate polyprenyltransferase